MFHLQAWGLLYQPQGSCQRGSSRMELSVMPSVPALMDEQQANPGGDVCEEITNFQKVFMICLGVKSSSAKIQLFCFVAVWS